MPRVLALCNVHNSPILGSLNETRSIASTSFLGRYAFIDFPLSNFANSGFNNIGILASGHIRSLNQHIGSGKVYTSNTKLGSISIMYPEKNANNKGYNTDINNIIENRWVINRVDPDYIVIAPVHLLYRFDFNEMLDFHKKKKSAVTMLYVNLNKSASFTGNRDELVLDENGRVLEIKENKGSKANACISLETYIINRKKFEEFIEFGNTVSKFYSLRDVLAFLANQIYIYSYEYKGRVFCFDSLKSYMNYSLELLDANVTKDLFIPEWPIYTRTYDTPPAKYGENAKVNNCFVANGALIDGKVTNCVVGRDVVIEKGVVIKNSIILTGAHIGKNAHIENCIIDKNSDISKKLELIGEKNNPLIVKEGDRI